jgi:hypothetical protein
MVVSDTRCRAVTQAACGADDTAIIGRSIIERALADIWRTPFPPQPCRDHTRPHGPIYVLKLQASPDGSGIRSLRALLKVLGRYHRLRCIDAREERGRP